MTLAEELGLPQGWTVEVADGFLTIHDGAGVYNTTHIARAGGLDAIKARGVGYAIANIQNFKAA